ncbi:hypothetical protein LOTGIDRAFT_236288 [Lottia gigantea]|uniref:BIG2 domain-containing protein n=1 Tax=Lottia gigantea TaxID=225164 RepID=V3Z185_LOTGI|nr:hypothetical protein LOTGIDRAFT_236288 [Lottia gigantea]ESO84308.1 hypothetical protein LOTGIDRAFT_236288 [Lottia gigantea]
MAASMKQKRMAATLKINFIIFAVILAPLIFSNFVQGAKLNTPKVLLPYYSTVISNFTLEVEFSPEEAEVPTCYQWRTTRPEVAQVTLINSTDGECALAAKVSAISKASHQMTTVVLAENMVTGEILRCDLIVNKIVKLEIETTTRVLYLEDSPDELLAKGFDSEGNIFTSLDGLAYEWSLVSDTETGHVVVDAHNILRIKRYTDSHYTTPAHIEPLEERGLQGDRILVEGIRTGSAKVSARLKDPVYKQLIPEDIRIMVIANLMLNPADVYVLPFSEVRYRVELLKHNKVSEITMPSNQYYLEVKDGEICTLEKSTSIATAQKIGSTEVVLKDKITEFHRQPSALFHVVNPSYIAFVVLPGKKWVLETDREYDILIEVYDTDSHMIFPSDNVRIEAEFPSTYFKVLFSSINGTYHRVKTLVRGRTEIDGELTAIIKKDGSRYEINPEVKGSQEVDIYDPIIVVPARLYFPWDPVTQAKHTYLLKASGGSGDYTWTSTDTDVTTVNIKGQITTTGMGRANVTAADAKNNAHTGSSIVHVLPPNEMMFLSTPVEATVGSVLQLPLAINAIYNGNISIFTLDRGKKVAFTDCHLLNLNISFSDVTVFTQVEGFSKHDTGCMCLKVMAVHQGHTEVTASYQRNKVLLTTTITIAAFNPLQPVDPEVETVVTVASSKDVVFKGGPQPWILDSSQYFQDLSAERRSLLDMKKKKMTGMNRGLHVFTVLCIELGEQELTLKVGNHKTAKNQFPITQTASIRYICTRPVELYLQPILNFDPRLPPCPVTRETQLPMPVHCKKDVNIQAIVTDSSGRKFDNFSSLAIEWKLSDNQLAELEDTTDLTVDITTDNDGKKLVKAFQTVHPFGVEGSVVVTATIVSYKSSYFKIACSSLSEVVHPTISKSLELLLRQEAVIEPSRISVFNHPSNKVTIEVQKGSGYFHLDDVETDTMSIKYDAKQKAVLVNPIKDGSKSITVYDLCLEVTDHPSATVHVSGVGGVDVIILDKVEVGKELKAKVQVLDIHGNPLLSSFFSLMNLKLEGGSDIITVRPAANQPSDKITAFYTVHGSYVGHTNVRASVKLPNGQVIYSSPKPLEVFPPLRLDPKNITLIVGAKFQVLAHGGPQPQSNVEFSIKDSKISTVSGGGMLEALEIGSTRVVGKAVGTDSLSGETVIYSQDEAIVNVIILTGIRIHAPLTRLQTGTKMPVYAVGITEQETPFTFGSAVIPLTFTWTYNSREPIVLHSVYYQSGVKLSDESKFAMQLTAVEAGHVTLKLQVTPKKGSRLQIKNMADLKDEVQIQVFEKLAVISPMVCGGQVLMTPNTETIVKTNRDSAAKLTYKLLTDQSTDLIQVKDGGQLKSGPGIGQAMLEIISEEEFGVNQTIVLLVKIKPISYLMINAETKLATLGGHVTSIPVGTSLQFKVSYHDDVGEKFYATNTQLKFRCSRYNLLHVSKGWDNNTLVVKTAEVGQTILKAWDNKNPWIADYVNIPVDNVIYPQQTTVSLTSIICFSTTLVTERGYSGKWSSESNNIDVDDSNGISLTTSIGKSTVVYTVSPDILTYTEIEVVPVKNIDLSCNYDSLTNGIGKSRGINVGISTGSSPTLQGDNCSAIVASEYYQPTTIPFYCNLQLVNHQTDITIADLFKATPTFDHIKGQYACRIEQVRNEYLIHQISTLNTKISLEVTLTPQEDQPEIFSDKMIFDFHPAFYVHNSDIQVTTTSPLSSLRVSTLPNLVEHIKISVSDNSLIEALSPQRDSQSGAVVLFPIRLLDTYSIWERESLDLYVELSSLLTGQKVKIPVFVKLIGNKPSASGYSGGYTRDVGWGMLVRNILFNYQSWFVLFFIILITAIAVLAGYHFVLGSRYKNVGNSSVFLNQSGTQLPPSPQSSFLQPQGTPPPYSGYNSTPMSPRLWSVNYNQPDPNVSSLRRSPYSYTKS